ncbi:MAG: hypothetical protein Q9157_008906 [Trypethelium eluteriae]
MVRPVLTMRSDSNRQIVIERGSLENVGTLITHAELASVSSTVLFNIFNDYEPAQKRSSAKLFKNCLASLQNRTIDSTDNAFNCTCQNLNTILEALDIEYLTTSDGAFLSEAVSFIKYIAEAQDRIEDLDDYLPLLNSCTILLRNARVREEVLDAKLSCIFKIFQYASEQLQSLPLDAGDPVLKATLEGATSELLNALCEMANGASPTSIQEQDMAAWKMLRNWLIVDKEQNLEACFICASLFLGNLAREDAACESLVHEQGIHVPLIERSRGSTDRRILHAAGGCLRNLAVPQNNKDIIAEAGAFQFIVVLLEISVVQELPYLGACITRQLVSGSFSNIQRLLSKVPTNQAQTGPNTAVTYLDALLKASARSDDFAIEAEVARTIAAIFRVLSTVKAPQDDITHARQQVLASVDILSSVRAVVQQDQSQPLCSEGWFTLALIAQSSEGAKIVAELMKDEEISGLLEKRVKGIDDASEAEGPSPQSSANKDRENAIVLATSLLQQSRGWDGSSLPETLQERLEQMLREQAVDPTKS